MSAPEYIKILAKGQQLLQLGRSEEALKLLQQAYAQHPNSAELLRLMAACNYNLHKNEDAYGLTLASLTIDPNDVDALTQAGLYYYRKKEYPDALECYERALAVSPDSPKLKALIGALHSIMGNNQAEEYLAEAAKAAPENENTMALMAHHNLMEGNALTALRYGQMALEKNPQSVILRDVLSESHIRLGNSNDAARHLEEAIRMHPNEPEYRYRLVDLNIRKFKFIRQIYPAKLFTYIGSILFYSMASLLSFGLLLLGELFEKILPSELASPLGLLGLACLSSYFLLPNLNRILGTWGKWGFRAVSVDIPPLIGQLNLQIIFWSLFLTIRQGYASIFFSVFLFCAAYGFAMAMYEAARKNWKKKAILLSIVILYAIGLCAVLLKATGHAVPIFIKYLLFYGFVFPLLLGVTSIEKQKKHHQ